MRSGTDRGIRAWIAAWGLLALAACAPVPPRIAPPPPAAPVVFAGSVLWREHGAMPPGARAVVTLVRQTDGGVSELAHVNEPARASPVGFAIGIAAAALNGSEHYALQARIEDAHGNVIWRLPQRVAVSAAGTATPSALLLVRVAPAAAVARPGTPAPAAVNAPPLVSALGMKPSGWNAFIYGEGRVRRLDTVIGDGQVRRSYTAVSRQRLRSAVVIFTANHGWVRLTVSPGGCSLGGEHYAWSAMLEVTGATFRGCASGIP